MAQTRRNCRNRKTTMRKNRKQRGAGFFDWFKSSTPAAAAPAAAAPNTTNVKAALNVNVPAAAPAAAPVPVAKRSFMNRMRNASGRMGSSLRTARNTMTSTAKNYGQHLRTMRNTMRGRTANTTSGFSQNYSMK